MRSTDSPALYVAYLTGREGSGVVFLYIKAPIISGIDAVGTRLDGVLIFENGEFDVAINMQAAAGTHLIGGSATQNDKPIPLKFKMPSNFDNGEAFRIELPFGPANVRFERIKSL